MISLLDVSELTHIEIHSEIPCSSSFCTLNLFASATHVDKKALTLKRAEVCNVCFNHIEINKARARAG